MFKITLGNFNLFNEYFNIFVYIDIQNYVTLFNKNFDFDSRINSRILTYTKYITLFKFKNKSYKHFI